MKKAVGLSSIIISYSHIFTSYDSHIDSQISLHLWDSISDVLSNWVLQTEHRNETYSLLKFFCNFHLFSLLWESVLPLFSTDVTKSHYDTFEI